MLTGTVSRFTTNPHADTVSSLVLFYAGGGDSTVNSMMMGAAVGMVGAVMFSEFMN
jgi:hypothetical protein